MGEPERLIRVKPERRAGSQARPNRLRKDFGRRFAQGIQSFASFLEVPVMVAGRVIGNNSHSRYSRCWDPNKDRRGTNMCSLRTGMYSLRRADKRRGRSRTPDTARQSPPPTQPPWLRPHWSAEAWRATSAHRSRCERSSNCDRERELRNCDHYEFSPVGVGSKLCGFGTPEIVTNLAIAGSSANVGLRLASLYWA